MNDFIDLSDITRHCNIMLISIFFPLFLPFLLPDIHRQIGDAIHSALNGPHTWPRIEAQPCKAGDVLCFSHRLLHWGGECAPNAIPR